MNQKVCLSVFRSENNVFIFYQILFTDLQVVWAMKTEKQRETESAETKTEAETQRQTDRQTDRQLDRQIDR